MRSNKTKTKYRFLPQKKRRKIERELPHFLAPCRLENERLVKNENRERERVKGTNSFGRNKIIGRERAKRDI